ncbi:MAG: class I SAM-dependent methyltransferase [Acetobacteraceae bacterium]|jgi:SAM-dependent methyltransferase
MTPSTCRFCGVGLRRSFVDLGSAPLSNSFLTTERLRTMEPHYPLHAYVCENCLLVQLEEFASAEAIFSDYLYFSSFSETWLRHAEAFAARMTRELKLCSRSLVVELASNDGYLLQYFRQMDVGVLGVEPAANVAAAAETLGVPTEVAFFGKATARRLADAGKQADLICANNVLAHVPDLNDFVAGLPILLKPAGTIAVEFPHLLHLMANRQFDTIYHEHFSYFSLLVVDKVFARHGLRVFDVDCLQTHGGSLRIHACHAAAARPRTKRFHAALGEEKEAGLNDLATYDRFGATAVNVKCQVLEFLIEARREGKLVAGYGAPAKGNTLLNYCGVGPELLAFTVDRSPHKQGRFLPGRQIPIFAPERIFAAQPDYVFILPWNLKEEIIDQMRGVRDWGGKFVVPIPSLQVI